MSREQLSALQEVLRKDTRPAPVHTMTTWPPRDPRKVLDAMREHTVEDVKHLLADVGLDDALPLLDGATSSSSPKERRNKTTRSMTARSVAFGRQTAPLSTTSSSSIDSSVNGFSSDTPDSPITIDTQPISCPVRLGATAAFYVGASCRAGHRIVYQWFKARTRMEGETREKLMIVNVKPEDRDQYTCRCSIKELNFHMFSDWCELIIVDLPAELTMDHPSLKPSAPSILKHPHSKEITEGKTVTLTVEADGVPYPTFQWYKSGVALQGQTSQELKLDHVGLRDSASYCCSVENENGSVISNTAQLRVQLRGPETPTALDVDSLPAIPIIHVHPQSMEINEGTQLQLRCHAIAQSPVSYNWYKNGQRLRWSGEIFRIPSCQLSDSGQYSCRVFTEQGYDNLSELAHVSVIPQKAHIDHGTSGSVMDSPSFYILAQPSNVKVEEGETAVFTCHAEPTIKFNIIEYEWYRIDGQPLSKKGPGEECLTLKNVSPRDDETTVYCRVSDGRASVKSRVAHLTVYPKDHHEKTGCIDSGSTQGSHLHIVKQPVSVIASLSSRVTLDCSAAGEQNLRYQWCKVDAPDGMQEIFNSDRSALIIYSLSHYNSGRYICKVSAPSGATVTTDEVEITVTDGDSCSASAHAPVDESLQTLSSISSSVNGPRIPIQQTQSCPSQSGNIVEPFNYSQPLPNALPVIPSQNQSLRSSLSTMQEPNPGACSPYVNLDVLQSDPTYSLSTTSESSTLSTLRREMAQCLFSKQPESQELQDGDVLRLSVLADGFPVPSYQWYKDEQLLPVTSRVLVIKGVTISNAGIYWCEARNEMGVVRSEDAFVKVKSQVTVCHSIN